MFAILLVTLPSFFTMQAMKQSQETTKTTETTEITIESLTKLQNEVSIDVTELNINTYKELDNTIKQISNETIKQAFQALFDIKVVAFYTLKMVKDTLKLETSINQVNISQKAQDITTASNAFETTLKNTHNISQDQLNNSDSITKIAITSLGNIAKILKQVGNVQDPTQLKQSKIEGLTLEDFFGLKIEINGQTTTIKDYILEQVNNIHVTITLEIEQKANALQDAINSVKTNKKPLDSLTTTTKSHAKTYLSSILGLGA